MDIYYINIVTNTVGDTAKTLLQNKHITIHSINTAISSVGGENIIIGINGVASTQIEEIILDISQLPNIVSAHLIDDNSEKVYFLFNINSNCKKTLKKVSHKPDTILDTPKDIVYMYLISLEEKEIFVAELSNLKLSYTYRMLAFT